MYTSLEKIVEDCSRENVPFWKRIQLDDCREEAVSEEDSFKKMTEIYRAMQESDRNYDRTLVSNSGLVGTDAEKIRIRREEGKLLCGDFTSHVVERALRVAESNACMRRIVAAPTAGSCGVMPAVLLSMQERYQFPEEKMVQALYVAAGIGGVIAQRATLSGAEGGCQAEIGAASGMAAGAAAFLLDGTGEDIIHACGIALASLLGLVCDPVAGLVEVPCVKRNVIGAMNAVTSCDMAMSGIRSRIPPDEVIDAMRTVGHQMAEDLRETGRGGLAATPTGMKIRKNLNGTSQRKREDESL